MSRLRLGIAGCGDIAGFVAFLARWNRGLALAACCDVLLERATAFARRHHIPQPYTDYAAMLERANLDAVYLAVPHHLHARFLEIAIEHRLPALVEKPVTRTLAEGVRVTRAAEAAGVKVAVNYQYRYDAGCYALARAVQEGDIGEVRYARINVPWHRTAAYFDGPAWHQSVAAAGGGTLITQGSHFLDVALWACDSPARRATGVTAKRVFHRIEVEDLAMGIVELSNGALVEICSSMAAPGEQAVRLEIYGSGATAIYSDRPFPHVRFVGRRVQARLVPVWGVHALQRSLEGFRRWVAGGQSHLVPASQALPVISAVEAIYRAARSGTTEEVEAVGRLPQDS
jgi:predicted dehydrogenase